MIPISCNFKPHMGSPTPFSCSPTYLSTPSLVSPAYPVRPTAVPATATQLIESTSTTTQTLDHVVSQASAHIFAGHAGAASATPPPQTWSHSRSVLERDRCGAMSDGITVSWVSDQLHELLGHSDRLTAEFLVGLAKKAQSPEAYVRKLQDTRALTVNQSVRSFATELWGRVPHKQATEKPARAREREILEQQARNRSYKLLSDSEDDEPSGAAPAVRSKKREIRKEAKRKRKNLRTEKASTWESESDEEATAMKRGRREESDSDEWEK